MSSSSPTAASPGTWRPQATELHTVACPLCAGRAFEVLASTDRYDMDLVTVGCQGCGLVMTNPQPTEPALNQFYTHHYRHYYQRVEVPDLDYLQKTRKIERAATTAAFMSERGLLPANGTVLDIGAAEGAILHAVRQREPSLRAIAVEPNPQFGAFARDYAGCELYPALESLPAAYAGGIDLIIINHVLEHIADPVRFLASLRSWLKPGGKLYIDVPDVEAYTGLEALHIAHLYHFCERSYRATLARAGYAVASLEHHTPLMHPPSLRLVAGSPAEPLTVAVGSGREGWRQLVRIERRAVRFHRRRWSAGHKLLHLLRWLLRPSTRRYGLWS